jgi:integrase/recombinase XerC
MLDVADFGHNAHAAEFADYGACYVRHGKASKARRPSGAAC